MVCFDPGHCMHHHFIYYGDDDGDDDDGGDDDGGDDDGDDGDDDGGDDGGDDDCLQYPGNLQRQQVVTSWERSVLHLYMMMVSSCYNRFQ